MPLHSLAGCVSDLAGAFMTPFALEGFYDHLCKVGPSQPLTSCIRYHQPQKRGKNGIDTGPCHIPTPELRTCNPGPAQHQLSPWNPDCHTATGGQLPLGVPQGFVIPVALNYPKDLAQNRPAHSDWAHIKGQTPKSPSRGMLLG